MKKYLRQAAYFSNTQEMDRAATQHRQAHWEEMNDTDRLVLDVIRQHSVKYGAAHLKYHTIADIIDKSHSTVRRAIRKLVTLNIVEKIHFVRPIMNGLGANIYAIKPFEDEEKKTDQGLEARDQVVAEIVLFDHEAKIEKNASAVAKQPVDTALEKPTFYERIQAFLSSTTGQTSVARNIFGVFRQVTRPLLKFSIHAARQEEFQDIAMRALHIAVQTTKKKNIRNLPGYFSGVFKNLISDLLQKEIFDEEASTGPLTFQFF